MRAAAIERYGGIDVLRVQDLPTPGPAAGEVLVRVRTAAVNPVDAKMRDGTLRFIYGRDFPMVVGLDLCGEVVELGADVEGFAKGDMVFGRGTRRPGGACAEFCAVGVHGIALVPEGVNLSSVAGIPIAGLTALQGMRDDGRLTKGDHVLIVGASGGVGTYAVQIAKALGATVTATCSTRNAPLVTELGADRVIDYSNQPTWERGVFYDLVFDAVGKASVKEARQHLSGRGAYVTTTPNRQALAGFAINRFVRHRAVFTLVKPSTADLALLGGWEAEGRIRTVVDSRFPLEEIQAAHRRIETHRTVGKIMIDVAA
jgi:NADPH:quinone reductase-like Zn-dependent oxidoreductase